MEENKEGNVSRVPDQELSLSKILVSVPVDTTVPSHSYQNHLQFMMRLGKEDGKKYKLFLGVIEGCFTPIARERICEAAVKNEMDYVLMFDDDMILPMDLLDRLLSHNVDIVAPLAFMKRPPYHPVIFSQRVGWERGKYFFETDTIQNYPKGKLFKVDAVGFGAVLIRTSVLKKLPQPWFQSTCGTGEDILFCFNAKQYARVDTYVDTSIEIGHLAPRSMIVNEALYENHNKHIAELRDVCGDWSQEKKENHLVA